MRGRCAFTSTWDLTPDYSYFTWLFTLLNEKETKREKKWSYREANFHRFSRTFSPVNSSEYSQNSKISQWSGDFLADQFNTTPKSSCTEHQVYTWLFLLFLLYLIVYYTKWKREKKRKEMKLSPTRDGALQHFNLEAKETGWGHFSTSTWDLESPFQKESRGR